MYNYGANQTSRPPPWEALIITPPSLIARWGSRYAYVYNSERPHEALGQKTPAALYEPSPRPYPDRLDDPSYGDAVAVRRVRSTGQIKWAGELIFVSEARIGEPVGVVETDSGDWLVRFANVELGYIHPQRRRLSTRPLRGVNRPGDLMEIAGAIPTTPQTDQPQQL